MDEPRRRILYILLGVGIVALAVGIALLLM
jgi:nitrogen fixation-related uncharacterized protein